MATSDKVGKIKEQKLALLEKLKTLEKAEQDAESDAKKKRKKADDRTKILIGIVATEHIKQSQPGEHDWVTRYADKLSVSDRKFLGTSELWKELGLPVPSQAAPPADAKKAPVLTPSTPPVEATSPAPKEAPKASTRATSDVSLPTVTFYEKDEAKARGARFNAETKTWYVPAGADLAPFAKWLCSST